MRALNARISFLRSSYTLHPAELWTPFSPISSSHVSYARIHFYPSDQRYTLSPTYSGSSDQVKQMRLPKAQTPPDDKEKGSRGLCRAGKDRGIAI